MSICRMIIHLLVVIGDHHLGEDGVRLLMIGAHQGMVGARLEVATEETQVEIIDHVVTQKTKDLSRGGGFLELEFATIGRTQDTVVLGISANFHMMNMDRSKLNAVNMAKCEQNPIWKQMAKADFLVL